MLKWSAALVSAAALMSFAAPAHAGVLDNVQITLGVSGVLPNESADISVIGGDVSISDEYVPTLAIEYFFNDNVSLQLLCCAARHDVRAIGTSVGSGTVDLGQITHFPPTLTLKYHWTDWGNFQPYVGAGVNYTHFFDEELPAGGVATSIDYSDSFGPALQAGFDYRLNEHWALNFDVRHIWINSDVTIYAGPTRIDADADINPWVITTGVAYRF